MRRPGLPEPPPERREYFGLEAIARRLRVSRNTVLAWYEHAGFLMYRRRIGPRWVWVSNDALIAMWEVARCCVDRQARLEARQSAQDGRS